MAIKIGKYKIRPEIEQPMYWVHLLILASVVLGILQYLYGGDMFTIENVLKSVPMLAIGDIVSHSLLGLD